MELIYPASEYVTELVSLGIVGIVIIMVDWVLVDRLNKRATRRREAKRRMEATQLYDNTMRAYDID